MPAHSFKAKMAQWGRVFGIEIPTDVSVALGIGTRVAVVGRVNDVPINETLVPSAGARHRLLLNAAVRKKARVGAGDAVAVTIAKDPSNAVPSVPDDLADALDILSGGKKRFDAWPAAQRREMLLWIADAINPEKRSRRIVRAVARVMEEV